MNHFHRVIFNPSLGVRQVVSEIARSGRGAGRQASAGSPSGTPRLSALAVASLLAWCAMPQAQAATCDAHSSAELVTCIGNANSGDTINLKNNITLDANLGAIHLAGPASGLTINGEGHTLDGNRMYRGFFVGAGNVSVNDLTLQNMLAKGGNGGEGYAPGGGGMGAGGAVFVAAGASANLHNVTIAANAATGGNGGNATEAVNTGLGGGGGMGGNGGGVLPGSSASGRGGGGLFEDGQIGSTLGNGGNGGGPTGGAGDTGSRTGGNGGNYSGGGGGSTLPNAVGGSGGLGGGGGGANSIGGDGGFGGGGGGGMYGRGGTGGFGGGGGSAGYGDGPAGGGGFGGSNGVSGVDSNANSGGGGGAGMGGGIFVMAGGSLTLSGNTNLRDNTVSGGTGGGSARSGAAFGAGIFLQGGTAQLAFAPDTGTQTVADAIADQTGSAGFGGSVGITKAGAGTTVLSGDNKYTGGTTITAGTLQIGGGGTTGAITGDVANNGTLAFSRSDTLNFSGVISGNGNVRQNGSGTLQLSRPNTYLGGTDLHAGVVSVSADNNLGDVSGALRFNGGVLQNTAGFTTDRTILFSPSPSGGIFQNDADLTITSAFHAPSLTKRGAAALVLAGDNVVSGGTTITAGTLQLGDGGTSGSITGSVVNDGTLAFNRTDDISFSGVISGMGNVRQSGTGTVTLSVANTYRGGTTINAGVLSIDADNKLGHTAGAVTFSGGTFQNTAAFTTGRAFHADASNSTFQTDADLILTSPVTGNGNLVKTGAATLVLEGNSTYAGNTTISGGTLQIGNGGASGKTSLGTITTDATLAFNRADDFTESNPIHGTGQVVQKGTGTLVLAGDNTYRGNTSMNAGVISVFSDGNLGGRSGALIFNGGALQTTAAFTTARAITLNVDGTLQTDADLNAAGVISGAGNLTKNGAGHLILSGENRYTGATTVNAGKLSVDGYISSAVTVNSGAALGGSGYVGSVNIASGGVLAPGNSIGTLTVHGNLTFAPGAVYRVETDAAGNADRVNVVGAQGTLTINGGTVDVQAGAGNYARNTSYTILTSMGATTGAFAGVTSNLAFLTPSLAYLPHGVTLNLQAGNVPSYNTVAQTPNQVSAANYLNSFANSPGNPAAAALIQRIDNLTAGQARTAFDAMSGSPHAGASQIAMALGRNFSAALATRTGFGPASSTAGLKAVMFANVSTALMTRSADVVNDSPVVAATPDARGAAGGFEAQTVGGLWGKAMGTGGRTGSDGNGPESRYRANGVVFGYDQALSTEWLGGIALGHTRTQWDASTRGIAPASGGISTPQAGLYARYIGGPWQVRLDGSYSGHRFRTDRTLTIGNATSIARSSHGGTEWAFAAQAEYSLPSGNWDIRPLAGLRHARLREDGFTETGAGAASLTVDARRTQNTVALLGVKLANPRGDQGGKLQLSAIASHLMGDNDSPLSSRLAGQAARFTAAGTPVKRTALTLGGTLTGQLSRGLSAYADAAYEYRGAGQNAFMVTAGFRLNW